MPSSFLDVGSIDQSSLAALMLSPERNRSNVGALAALVWDILVTMDEEVDFIWMTRFTSMKLLYFFTRYWSLIILIVLNTQSLTTTQWIIMEGVSAVVLEVVTEVILILRIRAMYEGNRRLVYALFALWGVQTIIMVVSIGMSIPKILASPKFAPVIPIEMIAYSIASILYETLLFALVVYKFIVARKEGQSHTKDSLLTILIRDSIWAFAAIFVVMVMNTLFFTLFSRTLGAFGFPWILAILGSVGPRLILNVRVEHARVMSNHASLHTRDLHLSKTSARSSSSSNPAALYPYSRTNSYQRTLGVEPSRAKEEEEKDDMYIPYTGPKYYTKDMLRRMKTLPPVPKPQTRGSRRNESSDSEDEETKLIGTAATRHSESSTSSGSRRRSSDVESAMVADWEAARRLIGSERTRS